MHDNVQLRAQLLSKAWGRMGHEVRAWRDCVWELVGAAAYRNARCAFGARHVPRGTGTTGTGGSTVAG